MLESEHEFDSSSFSSSSFSSSGGIGDDKFSVVLPKAQPLSSADPLHRVGVICGRLNAAHAELVDLVAELIEKETWALSATRTINQWLTCYAGVSPATARDLVAIATRRSELPALGRELDAGRLSLGQAAVVARHTPVGYDLDVVDIAVHATVPQLRRALIKYDFTETSTVTGGEEPVQPEPPDPLSIAALPPELSMYFDKDRFHLTYSAPVDIGALVQQALLEAKDALFLATQGDCATDTDPGRSVKIADAMEQLATRSLQAGADTVGRGAKFRVYLHLNTDGTGWVHKAGSLPHHLLRKWTCSGVLQPIWESEGTPVNVGRSQRIVPVRTRRLVEDRDRGCAFPGCLTMHHLECHRITHWADGGPTDIENLISLCPHHHDRHHLGDFTIYPRADRPGRFEFRSRGGWTIEPALAAPPDVIQSAGPESAPADSRPEPPRYIGPTNEVLHLDWVRFHRRPPANEADHDADPDGDAETLG